MGLIDSFDVDAEVDVECGADTDPDTDDESVPLFFGRGSSGGGSAPVESDGLSGCESVLVVVVIVLAEEVVSVDFSGMAVSDLVSDLSFFGVSVSSSSASSSLSFVKTLKKSRATSIGASIILDCCS